MPVWYNKGMVATQNLYASRVFSEHPLVCFPLDEVKAALPAPILTPLLNGANSVHLIAFNGAIWISDTDNVAAALRPLFDVGGVLRVEMPNGKTYPLHINTKFDVWKGGYVGPSELGGLTFGDVCDPADTAAIVADYPTGQTASAPGKLFVEVPQGRTDFVSAGEIDNIFGPLINNVKYVATYGFGGGSNGYYVVEGGKDLTENRGVPMVYGSNSTTKIYPSQQTYSIIKPEFRMWSMVKDDGKPHIWAGWKDKLVNDLLYEYEYKAEYNYPSIILPGHGFLNKSGRHSVATVEFWMRLDTKATEATKIWGPIRSTDGLYVKNGFLTLMVGNSVASHPVSAWYRPMLIHIILRRDSVSLMVNGEVVGSVRYNEYTIPLPDVNEDYVGFFGHKDFKLFEIDSYSIFPYVVPDVVAKRRFVWGQGVEGVDINTNAYDSSLAFIDYPVAKYTTNKLYPDVERWDAAYFSNLVADRSGIRVPDYKLPRINLGGRDVEEFYWENLIKNSLSAKQTFFTFRPDNNWTQACYLLFPSLNLLASSLKVVYGAFEVKSGGGETKQTLLKFIQNTSKDTLELYYENGTTKVVLTTDGVEKVINSSPVAKDAPFAVGIDLRELYKVYGNVITRFFGSLSSVQLMVGGDGTNTFEGDIYKVGLCDENNVEDRNFDAGFYSTDSWFMDHTAAYTLIGKEDYNTFMLDIAVAAYWEEYFPLSFFAKNGRLDFLQFNIGFPAMDDTKKSPVRSYLTFQKVKKKNMKPLKNYFNKEPLSPYRVLDASLHTAVSSTAFEVVDGTVVYPYSRWGIDETAVVIHLDIKVDGILSSPLKLRRLSLASMVLDENDFTHIGTKFGYDIHPYVKSGNYYDWKAKVPFAIYKDSTPYLYLTADSGIEVLGQREPVEKGISLPINKQLVRSYEVNMIELWVKYSGVAKGETLFALDAPRKYIEFQVDGGVLSANISGSPFTDITFYQDGNVVNNPVLEKDEWTIIGITFNIPLEFGNYLGGLNLLSGAVFNGFSFHHPTGAQVYVQKDFRPWSRVKADPSANTWQDWKATALADLLYERTGTTYPIGPDTFYDVYVGTNRQSVDDGHGVELKSDALTLFKDVEWREYTKKPL